jgi:hypothetical protein
MADTPKLQQFDMVEATFRPTRLDDLKPEVKGKVGERGIFQAVWIVEDGHYEGQWAMSPQDFNHWQFVWTPLCDLVNITPLDRA